ncbi:carboxylesterase/lipase family protein [Paraburkholderia caribensis]|uniref:carboxylesterase/lipase family protein n=1 Tax=Paraburkholderia caribensis TaxID=75105 RepID=UPI00078CB8FC|nr:carboxylesterase family protein [Paraburkholderia caribensis]AMV47798.1 hypothetical protein ATN79_44840 [Paraburkholderia caribensis]
MKKLALENPYASNFAKVVKVGLLTAVLAISGCGGGKSSASDPTVANTAQGTVRGSSQNGYVSFLGVPYAAPPVGALRWQPPAPAANRTLVLSATTTPAECVQDLGNGVEGSEDCLYLNIYRPANSSQKNLPVLMYIHGGDLAFGAGAEFPGGALAANNDVVVVSINYRLNGFGFLAHPALDAQSGGTSGAYGLLDQQAAMKWIKANIANFAGDPNNLTIFGQSSGADSVVAHIVSPLAAGLFAKAVVFSGGWYPNPPTLAEPETTGVSDATAWGCPGTDASALACLRALPASTIVTASFPAGRDGFVPIVDNKVLTMAPSQAFATGQFNKVPLLSGNVRNEWSALTSYVGATPVLTDADYATTAATDLSALSNPAVPASDILSLYPISKYGNATQAYAAAYGDFRTICQQLKTARAIGQYETSNYFYEFSQQDVPSYATGLDPSFYPGTAPSWFGSFGDFHASDVQFWLGDFQAGTTPSASNASLSTTMRAYLANFAAHGDPNGAGLPAWPTLSASPNTVLNLATPVAAGFDAATEHNCSYWGQYTLNF